jgi:Rrf2 family transcriptional regulator, cysteine metabolism repressor
MKLSTNSRYGLRAMVDLASHYNGVPLSLCAIAERQHISESYLEQAFSMLRKAGLIRSVKGAQGGYAPADAPEAICVGAVLRVLEGDLSIIDDSPAYTGGDLLQRCIKETIWDAIDSKITAAVDSVTLADLAREYRRMRGDALENNL